MKKITKHFREIIALMAILICATSCFNLEDEPDLTPIAGHDFEYNGIYYNITNTNRLTLEVTFKGTSYNSFTNEYSGAIVIPSTIKYNKKTYTVTSIGADAFAYCSDLTSVTIPNSVTTIGNGAFYACDGLTSINLPKSLSTIGDKAFYACDGLTSINLPDSLTTIGDDAFCDCDELLTVTIGNSVASIGELAFGYCDVLTIVNFNAENCTSMGSSYHRAAFYDSNKLKEINLGNNVKTIPPNAFSNCNYVSSITIPNSITSIGKNAFYGCSFSKVNITDLSAWCKIDFDGAYANPLTRAKSLDLNGSPITDLVIPNDITKINRFTFYDYSKLTSVTIPTSVTAIGTSAFYNCDGLTSVSIPNSVSNISEYAFSSCNGLEELTIGNSVTTIEGYAFADSELTTLNYNAVNCTFGTHSNPTFSNCSIKTLNIGDQVKTIPSYAFYNCRGLKSVTIGKSVSKIGDYAFYNCYNTSKIYSKAMTPPACGIYALDDIEKNYCQLFVPTSTLSKYQAADPWKEFNSISEDANL